MKHISNESAPHRLAQWPISETITCTIVTSFGGQLNSKKTVSFMKAEDSSEGLVKVAPCKNEKVYKAGNVKTHYLAECAWQNFDEGFCLLLEACCKLLP